MSRTELVGGRVAVLPPEVVKVAVEIISHDQNPLKDEAAVARDREVKFREYATAGIPEYWIVDARKEPVRFDIMRRSSKGYESTRKSAGWVKSSVFGKSFKLTQQRDAAGNPDYRLAVK